MPLSPRFRGFIRRSCSSTCGTAAVEFALLVPALLAMLLGICVYGLYLGAAHSLNEIAAAAARASVAGISDDERSALARDRVSVALAGGSLFPPGSVTVQVGSDPADASLYKVTLNFDARSLGLSGLTALLPRPTETLSSSVTVRRGGL